MMADATTIGVLLGSVPTMRLEATLARCVPVEHLKKFVPTNYLYASGKEGRFNPDGLACVYFSVDQTTAQAEHYAQIGSTAKKGPLGFYWADVRLSRVINLSDPVVLKHLGLTTADLTADWRWEKDLVATQVLGQVVASSPVSGISAIRFPSAVVDNMVNIVIFSNVVKIPDWVKVYESDGTVLQQWP